MQNTFSLLYPYYQIRHNEMHNRIQKPKYHCYPPIEISVPINRLR